MSAPPSSSLDAPTIPDALRGHASCRPDQRAVTFQADDAQHVSWTYRELDHRARAIAAELLRRHLSGRTALLVHPPGLEFIAALFGCFYAGVIAVPALPPRARDTNRSQTRLTWLVADAAPAIVMTTDAALSRARRWSSPGSTPLRWLATDTVAPAGQSEAPSPDLDPDSVALLQYTSGSMRSPKGVMLTHRHLMENQRVIASAFRHSPASHMMNWLPPYHDMGLVGGLLQPLTVGFPITLVAPHRVLQRPLRWLQTISRSRATTSGAPNSIYQLCVRAIRPEDRAGLDLRSWTVAYNGSEPVRHATIEQFSEFFAPCGFREDAFLPCYGLAESTLLVSGRAGGPRSIHLDRAALEQHRIRVVRQGVPVTSCGPPGPGYDVAIVDPGTLLECEGDRAGEIWVAGSSVAAGYWNRPDDTRETFERSLPGRPGRFLRTGDLGALVDGELVVTGRLKDIIIVRGRNVSPHDVENSTAASHPALVQDSCAAFSIDGDEGEQLVVACEVRRDIRHRLSVADIVHHVRRAVWSEFDVGVATVLLVAPGALPRTTSGKIRRADCRQAFLSGQLVGLGGDADEPSGCAPPVITGPAGARPESGSVRSPVHRALGAILHLPESWIDDGSTLGALGLDSLMQLEFLLRLEAVAAGPLDPSIVNPDRTVRELIDIVRTSTPPRPATRGPAVRPVAAGTRLCLTPMQREFLTQAERPEKYAIVLYLRTPPGVDAGTLRQSFERLERQHDAFRLRFRHAGDWMQELAAPGDGIAFRVLDMRDAAAEGVRTAARWLSTAVAGDLHLSTGPVAQAVLLDRGERETGVLFLAVHHLVADGVSMARIVFDLDRLYHGSAPMEGDVSFAEWTQTLDAFAQSDAIQRDLTYWRDVCGYRSDAPLPSGEIERRPMHCLDAEFSARFLDRYPRSQQQHDALVGALSRAWCEVTGDGDLLTQLESHGRFPIGNRNPFRTVGWCACRFPVRLRPDDDPASVVRDVPSHGLSYGLLKHVCRDGGVRRAMRSLASPGVGFTYRGRVDEGFRDDSRVPVVAAAVVDDVGGTPGDTPAIALHAGVERGMLWWRLAYRRGVGRPDLVNRLGQALHSQLGDV